MWSISKKAWRKFPYSITTAVFLVALTVNLIFYGPVAAGVTSVTFVAAVAIVTRINDRLVACCAYYNAQLERQGNDCTAAIVHERARVDKFVQLYQSMREDRAAFFKALTAVFPAGYRSEYYVVEMPLAAEEYGRSYEMQWYLYIDLPEELDLPYHQLRFVVAPTEMRIIGDLPDYNKQRVTLLESDSQLALRQYLATVAYEELKDNSDATDTTAESA